MRAAFCGAYHTFLLTESGNVYACGLNNMGQLGLGSLDTPYTGVPLLIPTLEGRGVVSLSGGEHHSLALTEDGDVYAFGRGDNNQLGLGVDIEPTPTKVSTVRGFGASRPEGAPFARRDTSQLGDLNAHSSPTNRFHL